MRKVDGLFYAQNQKENRKKYLEKGERTKRTHRLCNLGGTVESLAPEVKDLTRTEMTELMEHIFSLSEVQRAVRHMTITHISQGFYRYLNVAALPCSLIPTPPDDEQSPGIFHLQEDFE